MARHNTIGALGEDIAVEWLTSKGFAVLERNYRQKWGEIDIVARSKHGIHFVEVKSVSYGTYQDLEQSVSYGTWRPEEMVHPQKLRKLGRAIETWLVAHETGTEWQIDVITVRMVPHEKYARVNIIENVILEE